MKPLNITLATMLLSGTVVALTPWVSLADPIEPRGTTPYVTHFIFRPLLSLDDPISARPRCWRRWGPRKT